MFSILIWIVFGLIVGLIAKALHPGEDPVGFLPTLSIGVTGSFVGGAINYILGAGGFLSSSGFIMSIIGGIICCWGWRLWRLRKNKND